MGGSGSTQSLMRTCAGKCCSAMLGDAKTVELASSCKFTIADFAAMEELILRRI